MNKLVPMILFFLEDGEKPRHKVTNKIKNYSKDLRDEAISYLISEKLVKLTQYESDIGRSPVGISLTEKGIEVALEVSRKPRHNSVWNV